MFVLRAMLCGSVQVARAKSARRASPAHLAATDDLVHPVVLVSRVHPVEMVYYCRLRHKSRRARSVHRVLLDLPV
jgi:hypothetical protein